MGIFDKWNTAKATSTLCCYDWVINKEDGFLEIKDLATTENACMSVTNGLEGVMLEISANMLVVMQSHLDPTKVVIFNTNQKWDSVVWDFQNNKWIWTATEMPSKEIAKLLAIRHISDKQCDLALAMVKEKEKEASETIEEKMNRILQTMRTTR